MSTFTKLNGFDVEDSTARENITNLGSELQTVEGVVGDSSNGLVKDVSDLQIGLAYTQDTLGDEIVKVNKLCNYSTTEIDTGKQWINGEKIYRKVINFGTLPDGSDAETKTKRVAHSIPNLAMVTNITGIAYTNGLTTFYPLPMVFTSPYTVDAFIQTYVTQSDVVCSTNIDHSSQSAYIILEYVKS